MIVPMGPDSPLVTQGTRGTCDAVGMSHALERDPEIGRKIAETDLRPRP